MPLTLRPTGLQAFAHLADWSVYEDGQGIVRLREEHAPARPELAWFWSIIVMGPARHRVRTAGRAATLEEAKTQFAAAWNAFKVVSQELTASHRH